MSMPVVYFFEKIHVNHDEDEIAMIHLANFTFPRALVISQYLPRFGRKDLLEIASVPYSSQYVSERDLLQFQVLPLQLRTMPTQRMFLVLQFILEPAHLIQVLLR